MQYFLMQGIMPEIVGKWYSRKSVANNEVGVIPTFPRLYPRSF